MKLWVLSDEFWPWYNITTAPDGWAVELEVDEATARRWRRALSAASRAQDEIRLAVQNAPERAAR